MPLDANPAALVDSFGRTVSYLRLPVTDPCDLRCTYCMAEKMTFLPKRDLLSLEELARLSDVFIHSGDEQRGGEFNRFALEIGTQRETAERLPPIYRMRAGDRRRK